MCALNVLSRCLQLLVSGRGEADLAAVAENGVARIQVDLADVGEVARSTGEIASASVYVHGIIENRVQPRACHCLFSRCGGLIYEDGVAVLSHEMMLNGEKRGAAGTGSTAPVRPQHQREWVGPDPVDRRDHRDLSAPGRHDRGA